jgi:hypothetical protein
MAWILTKDLRVLDFTAAAQVLRNDMVDLALDSLLATSSAKAAGVSVGSTFCLRVEGHLILPRARTGGWGGGRGRPARSDSGGDRAFQEGKREVGSGLNWHMIRITGMKEEKMASVKRKEETKTKTKTEGKTEAGSEQSTHARLERYMLRITGPEDEKGSSREVVKRLAEKQKKRDCERYMLRNPGISRKAAERLAEAQQKRDYDAEFWKSLSPFHEMQPSYLDAENKANMGPIEAEVRLRLKNQAAVRHAANLQDALKCKAELGFLEARLECFMLEEERQAVDEDKERIRIAKCKDQEAKAFGPLAKFP